jgi:CRISPR/Cas system-associated exonuclease Cas4 (RecB family)
MTPFLKIVAEDLYKRFEGDFSNKCIVFPNQRAILYFNKYLSQIADKPIWAPEYITISGLMQNLSHLKKADDLLLLFELHKVYCKVRKTNESFDNFYFWGEMILADFDDVDKYMVDSGLLFQNLAALKDMNEQFSFLSEEQIAAIQSFWRSFDPSKTSDLRKSFINIWSSLLEIYNEYKTTLISNGIGYEGLLYRQVADEMKRGAVNDLPYTNIVFAGFNALNECEKDLFRYAKASGKALFYWDYDVDYVENKVNEAGFFIRENIAEFPSALSTNLFINLSTTKDITVLAVPSNVGQAKAIGQIIEQSGVSEDVFEKTAILLPDENLLMPVLNSIPESVKQLNITMGYPVKNSQIISLISVLTELWAGCKTSNDNSVFYYLPVLQVLKHSYVIKQHPLLAEEYDQLVTSKNIFWLAGSKLSNGELLKLIFTPVNDGFEFSNRLLAIIKEVSKSISTSNNDSDYQLGVEKEMLFTVFTAITRLNDILLKNTETLERKTFQKILMKVLSGLTVPFQGEPLAGMQVMGFLESRTLDFENLIILSFNEGFLPKTSLMPSFVPYNLRKGFGMPTLEYRDSMYAYYFYRVIQRANKITLVYNTKSEAMGSAEISRFASQLKYESKHNIKYKTQTFQVVTTDEKDIIIAKTPDVFSKLEKYINKPGNEKYLSPSALSAYIDCQLRFYFRYVAGIKELEKPVEEIDSAMLGRLLHKTLQNVYEPYLGEQLTSEKIQYIIKDHKKVQDAILHAIHIEYLKGADFGGIDDLHGRNLIVFRILNRYVIKVLEIDSKYAPFTITGMEKNISEPFTINVNGKLFEVLIGGNIDRIDESAKGIRIIDYKTGDIKNSIKELTELFNPEADDIKKEIFQAFLYSSIYKNKESSVLPVMPSLYKIRDVFQDDINFSITCNKQQVVDIGQVKDDLYYNLGVVLSEIYNPDYPFTKTTVKEKCTYCPYNEICHR